jgi:hypothetical protein
MILMIRLYIEKNKEATESGDPLVRKSIISSYVKNIFIFEDHIEVECGLDLAGGGGGS